MDWVEFETNCGSHSLVTKTIHCAQCGKTYELPVTYITIKSDFNSKVFCSYNCRCAYYKAHEQEREDYFEYKERGKEVITDERKRKMKESYKRRKMARKKVKNLDLTGISKVICYTYCGNKRIDLEFSGELANREVKKISKEGGVLTIEVSYKNIQ